jgi:hypothetical protein
MRHTLLVLLLLTGVGAAVAATNLFDAWPD